MNNDQARPAIPESIERAVRQKCFFGCVLCGAPVYDYDHIEEYAKVREHEASNLTLLCPNHHRDKTSGRLSTEIIKRGDAQPFNAARATTTPYGLVGGENVDLTIGTNEFGPTRSGVAIQVNGGTYLRHDFEGNWMVLSGIITDAAGEILFRLRSGAIEAATKVWDFTYIGTRLTMRSAASSVVLDATITNNSLTVHRGAFFDKRDRTGFDVTEEGVSAYVGQRLMSTMRGVRMSGIAGAAMSATNTATKQYNAVWQP